MMDFGAMETMFVTDLEFVVTLVTHVLIIPFAIPLAMKLLVNVV